MKSDFTTETLENLFVSKILTSPDYVGIFLDAFDKRWFENKIAATISNLVFKFFRKYAKIPSRNVMKALLEKLSEQSDVAGGFDYPKSIEYLNYIMDGFNLDIPDEAAKEELKRFVENRGLYYAISDNIEDIERFGNVDNCLKRFRKIQDIEFDTDIGMDYKNSLEKHFKEYIMNPEARVSTGWKTIDKITNGGFLKDGKSLYIFMGQAGLGKSAFLSNIAKNFLDQNMCVVVISLEMSEDVYAQRFDAHISGYNINRLNDDPEQSMGSIEKYFKNHPGANLIIKEYPPRTITTSVIEGYIEKLVKSGIKPDVIVVDYLNILKAKKSSDTMYMDGVSIAEDLRSLSYKFAAPVITAVQANSLGMNNEDIGMEHVAESRGIAHTADFLSALYQTEEDREIGIIKMRILKNRLGGRVGTVSEFKLNPLNLVLQDVSIDVMDDFSSGVETGTDEETDENANDLEEL